jgi:DNA repair photolyase
MDDKRPDLPRHGRGAISNPTGRFEPERREAVDDGWDLDEDLPPLRTTITWETPRTIIAHNDSPDIGFDQSINPYRGCEHGCIYCYARPSHAYGGMSSGIDFETKIFAKKDAARLLEKELSKPSYRCRLIVIGGNTDGYQPSEKHLRITRSLLEVLAAFNHPVAIITKSMLVLRDLDILAPMAEKGLAAVRLSVTTLDPELAKTMEPRASSPRRRLQAIRGLKEAGVPVGVMSAPMIPFLNDAEMEGILEAAAEAGATAAGYTLVRLPHEIKDLFREWLETHAPGKAKHVLSHIRESRDGKLNDSAWGQRMRGTGIYAEMLNKRFKLSCKRLGLNRERTELVSSLFKPPPKAGDQLTLL